MKPNNLLFHLPHSGMLGAMSKALLVAAFFTAASAACHAQSTDDGSMMHVYTKNSTEAALYQLDDIRKITFSEKGVRVWNTDLPTEYPFAKLNIISFRDRNSIGPTGVGTIPVDDSLVSIGYNKNNDVLTVKSDAYMDGVIVYNSQGQQVSANNSKRQLYLISLKNVGKGVYVVRARGLHGETIKKILK